MQERLGDNVPWIHLPLLDPNIEKAAIACPQPPSVEVGVTKYREGGPQFFSAAWVGRIMAMAR